jgi:hypothetical protein
VANEKLTFDLIANDKASAGFSAAGRAASDASDDVLGLAKRLDEISKKTATAKVRLDGDKDADLKLDQMSLKLLKLGRTVVKPDISVDGFLKATLEVKALELEMDKLDKKSATISASGSGLSKLEMLIGGLTGGTGGGSGGGGAGGAGFLSGITDALPVIVAAAPVLGALLVEADGLATGFAAAGAGVGAFALLALPTFKSIATAYTGIAAAQQKYQAAVAKEKEDPTKANAAATARALDALKVAQDNLSPSTKTAVGGIQALDDEYHKMTTAFAPDALKIFDDGLRIANALLPLVTPFADTAATALDGLLKHFEDFITPVADSAAPLKNMSDTTARLLEGAQKPPTGFQQFVASLHSIEGPALTAIGDNFGKLGVQVGKLFTIMSAKDVVNAINIGFGIIDGVLEATGYTVKRLMVVYDDLSGDVEAGTANVKLHTQQLVTFFTSTVPAGLEIFRNNARLVWDQVEIDVLHMASSVTGTMGKLPGPLGAPFRTAHTAIGKDLAGIEANVANTELQINKDWAKIHGVASIVVHADGTFKVGTTGLIGKAAGGLITGGIPGRDSVLGALMPGEVVVPVPMVNAGAVDHLRGQLPGFASGGVVGSYSGAVPGLGPWMGKEATASQAMLEKLTAQAAAAAMKALATSGAAAGPGGGAPSANAALARKLYASQLTPSVWAAWNAVAMRESGWNNHALNASSGAYGIPQALPPTKMPFAAQAGGGSNPTAQINWMWNYMAGRYGGPIGAEQHEQSFGWYDRGGYLPPGLSVAYNGTGRPEAVTTQGDMKAVVAEISALRADLAKHPAAVAAGVSRAINGLARGVVRL